MSKPEELITIYFGNNQTQMFADNLKSLHIALKHSRRKQIPEAIKNIAQERQTRKNLLRAMKVIRIKKKVWPCCALINGLEALEVTRRWELNQAEQNLRSSTSKLATQRYKKKRLANSINTLISGQKLIVLVKGKYYDISLPRVMKGVFEYIGDTSQKYCFAGGYVIDKDLINLFTIKEV